MKRVVLLVLLLMWSQYLLARTPAHGVGGDTGEPAAGGTVSGSTIIVGIVAPGQAGSDPVSADSPGAPRPYTQTWIPAGLVGNPGRAPVCDAGFGTPGWPYT